jgi:hypothetical protein
MGNARRNINSQGSEGFMDIVVVVTALVTFIGGDVLSEAVVKALVEIRGLIVELALVTGSELGSGLLLFILCVFP